MASLWKKQDTVFAKIKTYFEKTDLTCTTFKEVITDLIRQKEGVDFAEEIERVHAAEHAADEMKRDIILELYKKALVPGSRGDILGILETFDQLPNSFQSICNHIYFQNVVFPEIFRERIVDLVNVNIDSYYLTKNATACLFEEINLMDKCELIRQKEGESDGRERGLIRDIFNSDMELAEKMLLKSTVVAIGNTSDHAESVADRVERAIIKRRL